MMSRFPSDWLLGGFYGKTSGSDQEVIFKTLNDLVQTYTSRNVLRKAFSSSVHKE